MKPPVNPQDVAGGQEIDPNVTQKSCPVMSQGSVIGADPRTGRVATTVTLAPCVRNCAWFDKDADGCGALALFGRFGGKPLIVGT